MKKKLREIPILLLVYFASVQLMMFFISVLFAGGGHGTGIPLIVFYGPLLSVMQFTIFDNNPSLSFAVLVLVLFGLFVGVWSEYISKKILIFIMIFYILVSMGMLIYTEYTNTGLGSSNISLNVKIMTFFVSTSLSLVMWKILFNLRKEKEVQ